MDIICEFENKVINGLKKCGIVCSEKKDSLCLGAAVSGGADSVSLLVSLFHICKKHSVPLKVITVNHNIRKSCESCADADYVKKLCESLSNQEYSIPCTVYELKKGEVEALSKEKGTGTEDAARELRYKAFETFIHEENISFLCLAHNQNDQLETSLMRFLQGAWIDSSSGIPFKREKYIRPLLDISRTDIENFLNAQKIKWCTDSTNSDNSYLRNRIRNQLVPFLNQNFYGWNNAVLNGIEKAKLDDEIIQNTVKAFCNFTRENINTISIDSKDFYSQPDAVKMRLIINAANELGINARIPFVFLQDVCSCADNFNRSSGIKKGGGNAEKNFANLQIILKNNTVLVKKDAKIKNEIIFSDIIEESGIYEYIGGQVFIPQNLNFPVLFRSCQYDDEVLTAQNKMKKVRDILSDWHVDESVRQYVPVIQSLDNAEQKIVCILASHLGYKDWIVKK